jgi:hypothetical protein
MIETSNQNGVKTNEKKAARPFSKWLIIIISVPLGLYLFLVLKAGLTPIGNYPCSNALPAEAHNLSAVISDYFSIPYRNRVPTMEDLMRLKSYTPPDKRQSPRKIWYGKGEFIPESDLRVFISGDAYEIIEITVTSTKGQCFQGNTYRYYMGQNDRPGVWLQGYEPH